TPASQTPTATAPWAFPVATSRSVSDTSQSARPRDYRTAPPRPYNPGQRNTSTVPRWSGQSRMRAQRVLRERGRQARWAEAQPGRNSEAEATMRQLLEAGGHVGHQTRRWNPRMRPFIYEIG